MSYVYIMATKRAVKVGVSDTPEERLANIQTSNPDKVSLVYTEKMNSRRQAFNVEKKMLDAFSEYQSNGEWFVGLSIAKAVKALQKIKKTSDRRYVAEQERLIQRVRETVGVEALNEFITKAKSISPCVFVLERMSEDKNTTATHYNCLYAVTAPKYNKGMGKNDTSKVKHIGHLNKHGSVFREYDGWDNNGRVFTYIDEEFINNTSVTPYNDF